MQLNIYVKANHDLAKYVQTGIFLGFEEYMEVGQVEIAVYATLGGCLMCIKHTDTEEAYKWLKSRPKLLTSLSMKGRLMNDIAGFEVNKYE